MVAAVRRLLFLSLLALAAGLGAPPAGAESARSVMVIPLRPTMSESDGAAAAATDALYAFAYALPQVAWQPAGWVARRAEPGATATDFDPRTADGRNRLVRYGFDFAVTGEVGMGPHGSVTLSAWRIGDDAPLWSGSHPLPGPDGLSTALRALLPQLAAAMGLGLPPDVAAFIDRPYYATAEAIAAYGAGSEAYFSAREAAAIGRFARAIELEPGVADGHNGLGWALAVNGRWPEALGHFRQAADLVPGYFDALWGLQQALDRTGAFAEAAAVRTAVPPVYATHRDVLLAELTAAKARKDIEGAQAVLRALAERAGTSTFRQLDALDHAAAAAEILGTGHASALARAALEKYDAICRQCAPAVSARIDLIETLRKGGDKEQALFAEEELERIVPSLQPQVREPALERLAAWALSDDRDIAAAARARALVGLRTELHGAGAVETALALERLAAALASLPQGGAEEIRRALAVLEAAPDHRRHHGMALITLGRVHYRDKDFVQAAAAFDAAARILPGVDGETGGQTARARHWLADTLSRRKEFAASVAAYRLALTSAEAAYGARTAATADILFGLGDALMENGQPAEAVDPLGRAAGIREQVLGKGHATTAWTWYRLAQAAYDASDYEATAEAGRRAAESYDLAEGLGALSSARSLALAGYAARRMGRNADAERLLAAALPTLEAKEPADGGWEPYSRHELGLVFMAGNRRGEAEQAFRAAVAGYARKGVENITLADTWSDLGDLMEDENRWVEAVDAHQQALLLYERVAGRESRAVAYETRRLARALAGGGLHKDAIEAYGRALTMIQAAAPGDTRTVAAILTALGAAHQDAGDPKEAEAFLRKGVGAYEQAVGPRGAPLVWPLTRLGAVLDDRDALTEAEACYRRAFVLALAGGNPMTVWGLGRDLGSTWYRLGNREAAVLLLKMGANALQDYRRREGGLTLENRGRVLEHLAAALDALDRADEAGHVRDLLRSGTLGEGSGIALNPAEQAWATRLTTIAARISDLSGRLDDEQAAGEAALGWQALDRLVEELWSAKVLRLRGI